jgi:hypothetical protein
MDLRIELPSETNGVGVGGGGTGGNRGEEGMQPLYSPHGEAWQLGSFQASPCGE